MAKYLAVIAGSRDQYQYWIRENQTRLDKNIKHFYFDSIKTVKGLRNIDFEFYGSWHERNISGFLEELWACNMGFPDLQDKLDTYIDY